MLERPDGDPPAEPAVPLAPRAASPLDYAFSTAPITSGNRVELLVGGAEAYPAMLGAILTASREVLVESYILAADGTGRAFVDALAEAARRACDVRLIVDAVGSLALPSRWLEELDAAGVRTLVYHPVAPWRPRWNWWRRDHRKILVVDGAVAFTGGINLADEYDARTVAGRAWRDLAVRIEGPGAEALRRVFAQTWNRESPPHARMVRRSASSLPSVAAAAARAAGARESAGAATVSEPAATGEGDDAVERAPMLAGLPTKDDDAASTRASTAIGADSTRPSTEKGADSTQPSTQIGAASRETGLGAAEEVAQVARQSAPLPTRAALREPATAVDALAASRPTTPRGRTRRDATPSGRTRSALSPVAVAVLANRETRGRSVIRRAFLYALRRAQRSVVMANPYFIPDIAVTRALRQAAARGVDVRVVVPARSDVRLVDSAARHAFARLLVAGVRIAEWPGMMHAKAAAIDGLWATVGSYNFDRQSYAFNLEVTANVLDEPFAAAVAERLRADFSAAHEITIDELRARSPWQRILSFLAYQLRAIL